MNLTINNTQRQNPHFGIKMIKGTNIRNAEKSGQVSEIVSKQINELGEWMEEFTPLDREVVFDFEKDPSSAIRSYFQYLVKPFDTDSKTGNVIKDYAEYITGDRYYSEKEFLQNPISKDGLGHLAFKAEVLGKLHELGDIVLNLSKNK